MKDILTIVNKEPDYHIIHVCDSWRVAILNETERFYASNIHEVQKHTNTDEVFILISGICKIITYGRKEKPYNTEKKETILEKGKIYIVEKNVWHTHTLTENASVLVIESDNVSTIVHSIMENKEE